MLKVGAIYSTPKGVFGMITKVEGDNIHIKWDTVNEPKPNTRDTLKWAIDRKLIDYVGCVGRF